MLVFAMLMLFASYKMIRKSPVPEKVDTGFQYPQMILQGLLVGFVTGGIGAGGGFLIIPALVHFLKMPMKAAVGTSLAIIAINSLSGFVFSLGQQAINWTLLLTLSGIALIGILIGSYLSTRIDGKTLKPAFGWFVLVMGLFILIRETLAFVMDCRFHGSVTKVAEHPKNKPQLYFIKNPKK